MPRAHLYLPVTDSEGNVVPNTQVTIYEAGTSALIAQTIYTQKIGSPIRTNPWTTSDGYIDIWLERPQSIRIGLAVQGAPETYIDDLSVLPPPENMVLAEESFRVANNGVSGYFLQHGQPGRAAWVDAGDLVNSKPSPLRQIYSYDFTNSSTDNLVLTDPAGAAVTPAYDDVSAHPKPLGWEFFTQALKLPTGAVTTVRTPGFTFPETGTVIFLYRVVSAAQGAGAAMLRTVVDDGLLFAETPVVSDLVNVWRIGYLDEIPSGTHRISIEHRPGTDPASYVQIGPVWIQYGNNIPAHEHQGTADQTLRLGVGAEAAFAGGTAVGTNAKALGELATAYGFGATAEAGGTAFGPGSRSGPGGLALGSSATIGIGKTGALALGRSAAANDDYGLAIGPSAVAQGKYSVALGSGAQTGSPAESVALGASSKAMGIRSVAIGAGAQALHDYSVAIGPGVVTTEASQAMIGDPSTTVVVPGSFRQVGGSALFGAAGSKLGFFGSAGITRPTVTGSRGGNTTLAQLLQFLDGVGLIKDGTTA